MKMNDLGFASPPVDKSAMVEVGESRAVAEVQAAYVIAKKFPRNQLEAYSNIIEACKRPFLAEQALYAYPRGGKTVEGPSIRLAEAMCQAWGNMESGLKELSRVNGVSVVEAYCVDYQTNTRDIKTFSVKHIRDTKKGPQKLTDERDIYELIANYGARRKRACILALLPGDVTEAAVEQCKKTMIEGNKEPFGDRIRKLVLAFDELGVKVEHIEKRLGHNLDALIPQELVTLGAIYKSIRDGMSDRSAFFEIGPVAISNDAKANIKELIENKHKKAEPQQMDNSSNDTKQD